MSVSYFANWMGPLNQSWIDKNGQDWALGRIDISGVPSHPFGIELPLPTMRSGQFADFARFLNQMTTDEALPLDTLIRRFEEKYAAIEWLHDDDKALKHHGNGMFTYQVTRDRLDGRWKKNFGFDWASCCIDVFSPAGDKLSLANHYVPIMRADDMTSFGSFVNLLATPEAKTPQELARAHEANGNIIRWKRADHHGIAYWE
tara:strand:+ start:2502 stop:3107 length:606 start_codon:yes stop_codon:yes gene_type:complete